MKIKLEKMIEVRDSLRNFLNSGDMPFNISYRLSDAVPKLDAELKKLEKLNNDLVKKYGTKNESTGVIAVDRTAANYPQFLEERTLLLNEEFDLDIIPVSASALASSQLKISAVDVSNLKAFGMIVD